MKLKKILFVGLCLNFINVALSGATALPVPKISATPASVNLGLVALGASSSTPGVITVWNKGTSALGITSVITTGTDADEFGQTNNCGTVQPGLSCQVNITFTPNLPYAKKTATLAIASNDPKKLLLNVKLSGQVPPPAISATPASLNFGKLPSSTTNSSKTVTVTNKGLSDLVIDAIDISGTNPDDFTATSDCGTLPVAIPKGSSCPIDVVFAPQVPDVARSAILAISSNDPKKSPVSLKLAGSRSSRGPFSQSDLFGTWNIIHFYAGPNVTNGTDPGWVSTTATIDASSNVTVGSILSSKGISPPPSGTIKWTVKADGTITESGTDAFGPATNLIMSASKQLIVGTSSDGSDRVIRIVVKQDTGAFTSADIASKSLVYNSISSGASNIWSYGAEETDASGASTMLTQIWPSGAQPGYPKASGTLSVDANGLVANSSNSDFHGIMTPDKNVIFFVKTNSNGVFVLGALYISDNHQFNTGDLAGKWYGHDIMSSPTAPDWEHATFTFTTGGVVTQTNVVSSKGPGTHSSGTATLSSTGGLSAADDPALNGFISSNKDLLIVTDTWDVGVYSLSVLVK